MALSLPKVNVTDRLKTFAQESWNDFKTTLKVNDMDLDIDKTPEGHVSVLLKNVGFSAKLPGGKAVAEAFVFALHAGGVGNVETD